MLAPTFEHQEQEFKNNKRLKSALGTFVFVLLLLITFYFIKMTIPDPPFPELASGGVEINFGFDETGMGSEQMFSENPGAMQNTSTASSSSPPAENILSQDDEETNAIVPKSETKPVKPATTAKAKVTETNLTPQPKADPNALFKKGAAGTPNSSKGDGTGNTPGDQGKPDGDPNSKSYLNSEGGKGTGTGKGDGNVSLKGRTIVSRSKATFCKEEGVVIIDITVDRSGNVVSTKYHRAGSTITDDCSIQSARKSASAYKFNTDSNSEELQYGSITYFFTVQ